MATINTHGLKMHGLRKACSKSKNLTGYYGGQYVQISYDTADGDVLSDYHVSLGQNSWTKYHDPSVIRVCNVSEPATMQQIADMIYSAVQQRERYA